MNKISPDFKDVKEAYKRIRPFIHKTPVLSSSAIDKLTGSSIYFKCENFQKVGAFKYRGATNAVLTLKGTQKIRGVATHSSGNHAAAVALAARIQNIPAYIVIPENAPDVKKKAVHEYGGEITFCAPTLAARESALEKVIEETGATFIHPFNNYDVVCGQGTAALEFMDQVPELDILMTPVGGGGLLSGSVITARALDSKMKVYGTEPAGADDAFRSFKEGKLIPQLDPKTIADGLLTSLSELTFSIIHSKVDDIFTVSETSIVQAMRLVWERMKIIIEPSSAVPLAAVLENPEKFNNARTGIILTGGNVDLDNVSQLFSLTDKVEKTGK